MTEVRRTAATSASLWERDEELAAVEQAVALLCADRSSPGSVLVFEGDAGMGKTALLTETRRIAEAGDGNALEALRVAALGKAGEVTALLKTMGALTPEERQEILRQATNDCRSIVDQVRNIVCDRQLISKLRSI